MLIVGVICFIVGGFLGFSTAAILSLFSEKRYNDFTDWGGENK